MSLFDPNAMPVLKMIFGFLLLLLLAVLAGVIALGRVEQTTSHGLDQILGGMLVLAGGFAHWAFGGEVTNGKQSG